MEHHWTAARRPPFLRCGWQRPRWKRWNKSVFEYCLNEVRNQPPLLALEVGVPCGWSVWGDQRIRLKCCNVFIRFGVGLPVFILCFRQRAEGLGLGFDFWCSTKRVLWRLLNGVKRSCSHLILSWNNCDAPVETPAFDSFHDEYPQYGYGKQNNAEIQ